MEFIVCNRKIAESRQFTFPHIMISISNPLDPHASLPDNPNRIDVRRFKFHDADIYLGKPDIRDSARLKGGEVVLFSDNDAEDIIRFIEYNLDSVPTCVVHCAAGISRSPGVAAALSKIFNNEDDYYFKRYRPNLYIYNKIMNNYYKQNYNYEYK